jgi:hypothetical protein
MLKLADSFQRGVGVTVEVVGNAPQIEVQNVNIPVAGVDS